MHDKQLLEPTPDISRLAAVFANSARSALCSALMSGTAWTVGELAAYAHIARSTASEHVTVLVEAGIAREYRQGRHRYVTISGPAVGDLIERLGALSAAHFDTPHSLNASRHTQRFPAARTCYKHLAGRLGLDLAQWLVAQGYTDADFRVTPRGALLMERWGVAAAQSLTARPALTPPNACLTWEESSGTRCVQPSLPTAGLHGWAIPVRWNPPHGASRRSRRRHSTSPAP
ncbi:MAG: winged helix-turn-helix domain-containing protein [Corynebacterium flavescens]|uniref:ArsR/SmtB family transcription factor n=1 Tax=Corynebacterium flavescens TaxID=28028 RepID=UPI00264833B2|nr:winged helix-turn-helix domain-containing protein [Corynebacterium flavescens]MDN6100087.1 winged helix-turn-helix domain-containing protein [Corynebacterium flavescens]